MSKKDMSPLKFNRLIDTLKEARTSESELDNIVRLADYLPGNKNMVNAKNLDTVESRFLSSLYAFSLDSLIGMGMQNIDWVKAKGHTSDMEKQTYLNLICGTYIMHIIKTSEKEGLPSDDIVLKMQKKLAASV